MEKCLQIFEKKECNPKILNPTEILFLRKSKWKNTQSEETIQGITPTKW